jgi:predicted GNAT family acetyltransferase
LKAFTADAYAEDMSHEFDHEPDARRYVMRVDGQLACVVDYSVNGAAIALTRTYTQPPLRGHGYAAELVRFAIDDIETTTSYRVVPTCWYVGEWFEKHPERTGLLSR